MIKNNKVKNKKIFFDIYYRVKKIYEDIFIINASKKIYWFGVACLPLIYFSTIFVFSVICSKSHAKILYSYFQKKISIKTYEKSFLKRFILKTHYIIINYLFFFKKKIYVVYSKSRYVNKYCEKKNFFQIKLDPLWFVSSRKIDKQIYDNEFSKKLDLFIFKLFDNFFLTKKHKDYRKALNNIKNNFIYYYRIYLIFNNQNKNFKNSFYITGYTGVIFVRLFLASLRSGNRKKVITVTHGDVEILNQLPDLISDASLLGNYLVCKASHFKKKYKIFFQNFNRHYIQPKILTFKDSNEIIKIKKRYLKKREDKKRILIVGYPHSCHYDLNVPQITPNTYHKIEIQVMKILITLGYDVTYNIHPDRLRENINLFKKNFQISTSRYEDVEKNFDYSLFTYHRSTALGHAMKTNSPILVLGFKNLDFDKYTSDLLSKRISFIDVSSNISNSLTKSKIKKSKNLVNYNSIKKLLK